MLSIWLKFCLFDNGHVISTIHYLPVKTYGLTILATVLLLKASHHLSLMSSQKLFFVFLQVFTPQCFQHCYLCKQSFSLLFLNAIISEFVQRLYALIEKISK
ncbi:MAG: hypothetical protein BM565_00805 [Gammaproteobacteria bacterium MedPE]|nr:MAG: hypothetical protein BM565_00805 [Gammaproteobacteria bacterium MedPE]